MAGLAPKLKGLDAAGAGAPNAGVLVGADPNRGLDAPPDPNMLPVEPKGAGCEAGAAGWPKGVEV